MVDKKKLIVAITGASGTIYGIRILERLRQTTGVESHLILSRAAERTAHLEMDLVAADIRRLADVVHPFEDIGSNLASGSFRTHAMVIAPCSIHTMSAISTGLTDNLITRAADVMLKERRRLVLMVREMPFHLGHLRTMVSLAEMGAIIAPPVPAFYRRPQEVIDLVDHAVDRVLDLLDVPDSEILRWNGRRAEREKHEEI